MSRPGTSAPIAASPTTCRNRHCPKCQGLARAEWLAERQAELLPVPYFHVVFTLPARLAEIAFQNKAVVYAMLFQAAAETLKAIAADPPASGRRDRLHRHPPHLGADAHPSPARPLRRARRRTVTRRPALDRLPAAFLPAHPCPLAALSPPIPRAAAGGVRRPAPALLRRAGQPGRGAGLAAQIRALRKSGWVVYAKPPFRTPEQVLAYLGRYTHRVAIANSRLVAMDESEVRFQWRDYRQENKTRVMTLDAQEFIRRFLLHSLPDGFHRIRHYGFLANGHRTARWR